MLVSEVSVWTCVLKKWPTLIKNYVYLDILMLIDKNTHFKKSKHRVNIKTQIIRRMRVQTSPNRSQNNQQDLQIGLTGLKTKANITKKDNYVSKSVIHAAKYL